MRGVLRFRKMSGLSAAVGLACVISVMPAVTSSAHAQTITPYTFAVDEGVSHLQVQGTVMGFKLIGDRKAAIGGDIDARLGNNIEPFRGFKIDDSTLIQLDDINAELENPIPWLPPIGHIDVTGITARLTTGVVRLNADGTYTTNKGSLTVLSGTLSGDILGIPIAPVDLAGNGSSGLPLSGSLLQDGDFINLEVPVSVPVKTPDVNLTFSGGFFGVAAVK
ncbi:MAG: hypothetical protein D8M59_05480 [Planctomycetes bacterium]|nr:hypothetical protein [Planctomycetota bacterium]NOG55971.1 hypothetical protein [Planctomycetota bacterium]